MLHHKKFLALIALSFLATPAIHSAAIGFENGIFSHAAITPAVAAAGCLIHFFPKNIGKIVVDYLPANRMYLQIIKLIGEKEGLQGDIPSYNLVRKLQRNFLRGPEISSGKIIKPSDLIEITHCPALVNELGPEEPTNTRFIHFSIHDPIFKQLHPNSGLSVEIHFPPIIDPTDSHKKMHIKSLEEAYHHQHESYDSLLTSSLSNKRIKATTKITIVEDQKPKLLAAAFQALPDSKQHEPAQ